jgi:hypothetical protein
MLGVLKVGSLRCCSFSWIEPRSKLFSCLPRSTKTPMTGPSRLPWLKTLGLSNCFCAAIDRRQLLRRVGMEIPPNRLLLMSERLASRPDLTQFLGTNAGPARCSSSLASTACSVTCRKLTLSEVESWPPPRENNPPWLRPRECSARTTSRSPIKPDAKREVPPCSLPEHRSISVLPQFPRWSAPRRFHESTMLGRRLEWTHRKREELGAGYGSDRNRAV